MSLLLLVSFYEFRQFLQIVLWIAVPATLIAIGLTIFFHYRRKKKQEELGLAFNDNDSWAENLSGTPASATVVKTTTSETPEGLPDWLASANPDNTPLLKKYEHEVRRYRENYAILEQEFRELEGKYTDLRNKAYNGDKDTDTTLVAELQETQQRLQQVQEENNRLQQLVALSSVSANGRETEGSIQVLQQLLEQQIKNYHLLEHQAGDSAAQLQQLQATVTGFDQQIRQLTGELHQQQQKAEEWQSQLEHSGEVILAKTGHIEKLEHNVQDLQQHQALLQTEIADQQDAMRTLQENLVTEQQKAAALETKLEQSSRLLVKIYGELAKSINHNELMVS